MMRRHVPLIVTLLLLACGNEPTSPSSTLEPTTRVSVNHIVCSSRIAGSRYEGIVDTFV
jgi:hypothetical protein